MCFRLTLLGLALCLRLAAQTSPPPPAKAPEPARPGLGAAAQRNENVQVHRIDNDAVKEANIRLGASVTFLAETPVQANYYAAEHGRPPAESPLPAARRAAPEWRGEVYHNHQNSVFNARTFFQVGPVRPSRRNSYGWRAGGAAGPLGRLSLAGSQRKIRGMVNGNVLVPLAGERAPLAKDPAVRALISRWLEAYPSALPNRPDFDPRALNTNAPQRIDETDAEFRLDRPIGALSRLVASHALSRQREAAFQLVAGQNPDTDIHSHRARLSWRWNPSPAAEAALGFAFDRTRSWLRPEPRAIGPRVRIGFQIEELGPDSMFPIDRAENAYCWAALFSRRAGARHALTFGGDLTRVQLNGVESNNQRGYFQFTNNFGRSAVENFLWGTPTTYEVTVGELARGFRNWRLDAFLGDQFAAGAGLQIYFGLRYNAVTTPREIHGLNRVPYRADANNFSPRLGIAWRATSEWTLRAAYSVSFGEILPVTYQQIRNNLPHVRYLQVQNPDLRDPLAGVNLRDPAGRASPTWLAPDLVAPYAHQYRLGLERRWFGRSMLRAAYVGSRSLKLLNSFIQNRAEPVPGIPLTTATVDQRRPDPRYYEIKRVVNAGMAYLDAAQLAWELPLNGGLAAGLRYTFGKAIDEGVDYSSTAANADILRGRSQWQYEQLRDRRGLSNFDSPHALEWHAHWELPSPAGAGSRWAWLLGGWQISAAALLKSGTPFTLYVGSDAPGFGNVDGGPSDRPNLLDPSILGRTVDDPNASASILRADRFAFIRPGEHRGNLGRNTFRKDGIANLNAALGKQWRWNGGREWTLLVRAEAYNLANHPQFDEPQRNLSSPSFGRITNTLNDGRVFQLGWRLML